MFSSNAKTIIFEIILLHNNFQYLDSLRKFRTCLQSLIKQIIIDKTELLLVFIILVRWFLISAISCVLYRNHNCNLYPFLVFIT